MGQPATAGKSRAVEGTPNEYGETQEVEVRIAGNPARAGSYPDRLLRLLCDSELGRNPSRHRQAFPRRIDFLYGCLLRCTFLGGRGVHKPARVTGTGTSLQDASGDPLPTTAGQVPSRRDMAHRGSRIGSGGQRRTDAAGSEITDARAATFNLVVWFSRTRPRWHRASRMPSPWSS